MHPFFKRKVLRRRQRHARRRDTFYRRIVGKIHKQYGTVDGSRLLKTLDKKLDSSNVIPIAAKTTANFSSFPLTFA